MKRERSQWQLPQRDLVQLLGELHLLRSDQEQLVGQRHRRIALQRQRHHDPVGRRRRGPVAQRGSAAADELEEQVRPVPAGELQLYPVVRHRPAPDSRLFAMTSDCSWRC